MGAAHRSDVRDLIARAHALLEASGAVGPVVAEIDDLRLCKGDQVMALKNRYDIGILNGDVGEIIGAAGDANHRTKLIFPSGLSDMTTANFISQLVGDEAVRSEIEDRRLLTPAGARRSPTDRSPASSTPFLPPHVLRSACPGDALVTHGSLPPAWIEKRRGQ
jgi:hypothetical protein